MSKQARQTKICVYRFEIACVPVLDLQSTDVHMAQHWRCRQAHTIYNQVGLSSRAAYDRREYATVSEEGEKIGTVLVPEARALEDRLVR